MPSIEKYFKALERLKKGKPINIALSSKINNRNVALEAGSDPSAIKKSRPQFQQLIQAIKEISNKVSTKANHNKKILLKHKEKANEYKLLYQQSLNRELMLINKIDKLQNKGKGILTLVDD